MTSEPCRFGLCWQTVSCHFLLYPELATALPLLETRPMLTRAEYKIKHHEWLAFCKMAFEAWFTASISVAQNSFSVHHPSPWLSGAKGPFWKVVRASKSEFQRNNKHSLPWWTFGVFGALRTLRLSIGFLVAMGTPSEGTTGPVSC